MKTRRILPSAVVFVAALATLFFTGTAGAQTANTYQWNGTSGTAATSPWTTLSAWSGNGGAIPSSGSLTSTTPSTYDDRLQVYNNTNSALVYTSSQGYTDYANTGGRGLVIGSGATNQNGAMIITGGTFSTAGSEAGDADVFGNTGATGTLTIAGGVYVSTSAGLDLCFASNSAAYLIINSGSAIVPSLVMGTASGGTSTVNLNGGTLVAGAITTTQGAFASLDFNGGTLIPSASSTAFLPTNSTTFAANVQQGGAFINPNGYAITIGQALLHSGTNATDGGLTLSGSGILTLSASNNYNGGTVINGGTLVVANTSNLGIGTGSLTVNSGGTLTLNNNVTQGAVTFGGGTINGTAILTGASFTFTGGLVGTALAGSTAPLTVNSGLLTLSASNGYGGGTTINGGTLVASNTSALGASTASLAVNSGGVLTLNNNITQGAVTIGGGTINGTAILTGTSFTSNGGGSVSPALAGASAPLTLNAGLLTLFGANTYSGSTTISGGTLQISGAGQLGSGAYAAAISNSGTLLYNSSAAQTLSGIISGTGAVTQAGNGTLSLTGSNNTYTGTTTVNAGLLAVTGSYSGGGAFTINGGTLGGLGNIAATVNLNAGTSLFPGAAGPTGTMTLGNLNVAGTNNTLVFDLAPTVPNSGNDLLAVAGTLSLAGTATITVPAVDLGHLGTANYPLITYGSYSSLTNAPSNDFTLAAGVLTSRQNGSFVTVGKTVYLDVVGSAHMLTWDGSGSNTWDNGTSNTTWITSSGSADIFVTNDSVTFSNSGSQANVNVNAAVAPGSVLVTGSNNYVFSGSGSIGGLTTPVTMQGSGVLTLATTGNTYGGGTFVQSGTLAMGVANALPTVGAVSLGSTGGAPGISGSGTLDRPASIRPSAAWRLAAGPRPRRRSWATAATRPAPR